MEEEIDVKPVKNEKCPVDGCDSSGHINGSKETHFLRESCPYYHNLTKGRVRILPMCLFCMFDFKIHAKKWHTIYAINVNKGIF